MQVLTGRCLCEGIQYRIEGSLGPIYNCHCSKCRRWHGAAFRTRATVQASRFHWISGEELLARFHSSDSVVKTFCSRCGSNLVSLYDDRPDVIGVPLGGLDQAPQNQCVGHIFVGSRSPWYEITDEFPQYDELPGSMDAVLETSAD
jgi:hypothetical protein